tara:strand:- start:45948 stop:49148 length:3201 start_codon:yes stop_codon:yes gene_type:complete
MPKQKYTAFDVAAVVAALRRSCLGCWCANVYDVDARTYALKFNKSSGAVARDDGIDRARAESEKIVVLIESGCRVHRTKYDRGRREGPSKFTQKVRMHVKTRRLNDVRQIGKDRAIDFTFGAGETECHVIVELYSQGNVVLTDGNYTVLTLLRTHRDDEKGVKIMGNHQYPLDRFKGFKRYDRNDVVSALERGAVAGETSEEDGNGKEARAPGTLREALCRAFGYSPAIVEHIALTAGIEKASLATLPFDDDVRESCVDRLAVAVHELESWFEGVTTGEIVASPHVCTKMDAKADGTEEIEIFDDFSPFVLKQNEHRATKTFDLPPGTDPVFAFDNAVDEYFMALEAQSQILARRKAEQQAIAKLEKSIKDQKNRVEQLEREREKEEQRAMLIEYNHEAVDTAIEAVNSALANGMSWAELEAMINEERRLGNPVAGMIKTLDLDRNHITIMLSNDLDVSDEDAQQGGKSKRVAVSVDLGLSAHANASMRFAAKKKHAEKFDKTMDAQARAVAAAEAKAKAAIEKVANGAVISKARQTLWFEKFNWFITTENCLVLQAKDATQADMIMSRYMLPGDAFVHADVPQAPVTLAKPPPGSKVRAVPAYSLVQAGAAVMCRSSAWNSRAVKSAWWTTAEKVSKISPVAGDRLPPGEAYVAHADKQFLPHAQLIMGFGLMFVVSEKNADAHKHDRLVRSDITILEDDVVDEDDGDDSGDSTAEDVNIKRVDKLADDLDDATTLKSADDAEEHAMDDDADGGVSDRAAVREQPTAGNKSSSAPRMSAKERKLQKKKKKGGGGKRGDSDDDDDFVDPLAAHAFTPVKAKKEPKEVGPSGGKALPRGKAAKLKRAKAKYADQDEEDRALAMNLLGAGGGSKKSAATKKAEKKAEQFEERKLEKPEAPTAPTPAPPLYKLRAAEKHAKREDGSTGGGEADDENDENGDDETSGLSLEERLKLDDERVAVVNRIVGAALKNDDIEYCLPVCAPMVAVNALRFRLKLTPGSQKKGKGAKLAMDVLSRVPFASPAETAAVKLVPAADCAAVLPGGVKISLPPGALKLARDAKKSNTSKR